MNRIRFFILSTAILLLGACRNDVKEVQQVSDSPRNYPLNEQIGATIIYSDSGQKMLEIHAGLVQDYGNQDPAYVFFGDRIRVQFYNGKTLTSTSLTVNSLKKQPYRFSTGRQFLLMTLNLKGMMAPLTWGHLQMKVAGRG